MALVFDAVGVVYGTSAYPMLRLNFALVSTEHYHNRDPRKMNYLAGILCNGDLILKNRKIIKNKEGNVRSVLPFSMRKNNTACNMTICIAVDTLPWSPAQRLRFTPSQMAERYRKMPYDPQRSALELHHLIRNVQWEKKVAGYFWRP